MNQKNAHFTKSIKLSNVVCHKLIFDFYSFISSNFFSLLMFLLFVSILFWFRVNWILWRKKKEIIEKHGIAWWERVNMTTNYFFGYCWFVITAGRIGYSKWNFLFSGFVYKVCNVFNDIIFGQIFLSMSKPLKMDVCQWTICTEATKCRLQQIQRS